MQVDVAKIVKRGGNPPLICELTPDGEALLIMLRGFFVSSQLACQVAATVQSDCALGDEFANRIYRNDAQEEVQAFLPVAADQPEPAQRQRKAQLRRV